MKTKTIFYKSNNSRRPEFQTKLVIVGSDYKQYVIKSSLSEISQDHINKCYLNAVKLSKSYPEFDLNYHLSNGELVCDCVHGTPLSEIILTAISRGDSDAYIKWISWFVNEVIRLLPTCDYAPSAYAQHIFGMDKELKDVEYSDFVNIDFNFDNIILMSNSYKVIDTEWFFEFPLPKKYIIFRAILYLFVKYGNNLTTNYDFKDTLIRLGISNMEIEYYYEMENNFQNYVYGKNRYFNHFISWCHNNREKKKDYFITQLYYSSEEELSEEYSVIQKFEAVEGKEYIVEFNLLLHDIRTLRLDPVDLPAILKISSISYKCDNSIKDIDLTLHYHNANIVQDKYYSFLNKDSQFIIGLNKETITNVKIVFELIYYVTSNEKMETVVNIEKQLTKYNDELKQLKNDYENQIGNLQNNLAECDKQLFYAHETINKYRHPVKAIVKKVRKRGKL